MRPTSKIALSWRVISYILLQIIINMLKNEHKSCFAWCSLSTAFIFEVENSIRIKKQKGNCFLMTLDSFSTLAVSQNKDVLKMGVSPFERNKKKLFRTTSQTSKSRTILGWSKRSSCLSKAISRTVASGIPSSLDCTRSRFNATIWPSFSRSRALFF